MKKLPMRIYKNGLRDILDIATCGLCTGCGVCAAICPHGTLSMRPDEEGEFIPFRNEGCKHCAVCNHVCPQLFTEGLEASSADILAFTPESVFGYQQGHKTWAGYAENKAQRLNSASGGILTLVLRYLLDAHEIDVCIVAGSAGSSRGLLFESKLVRSPEQLDSCAGSKYYPIEFSKTLKELMSAREQRAAIVGLPCHVNGIRSIMRTCSSLNKQILYIFGLACGHGVSAHFTDILLTAAQIPLGRADRVSYREKGGRDNAADFGFSAFQRGHKIGKTLYFEGSAYGAFWNHRVFVPVACDFCADCFAEKADATFMDAWLPEYVKDPRGTSLIISRTNGVNSIISRLSETGRANFLPVTPNQLIRSQLTAIRFKRELLPARVYSAISRRKAVPQLLVRCASKGTWAHRRENSRYGRCRKISRFIWRLQFPASIRFQLIRLFVGINVIQTTRSSLMWVAGNRGKQLIKYALRNIKLLREGYAKHTSNRA